MTTDSSAEARLAVLESRMHRMEQAYDELRHTMSQVNTKLTGVLAAVAASAVMLAINLVVNGWSP